MLQQTRVETVIPYFHRFLERFPTVEALAEGEIEEVLALWSGLGYYRRARQLHQAAREVVNQGGFSTTLEGLRSLPGIGEYTAAAVGSIAFGIPVPVLDGNVERVLSRVLALEEDPKVAEGRKALMAAAKEFLDERRPGDSNQALMELGATVCTPKGPACLLCPLTDECRARQRGEVERYPRLRPRKGMRQVRLLAVVVVDSKGRVLLFRRSDDSTLLAGTWEVPWIEAAQGEATEALARRYGGTWNLEEQVGEARHAITFRSLTVEVYRGRAEIAQSLPTDSEIGSKAGAEVGWFQREEIKGMATSSLVGKVLRISRGRHRRR
jgi:A/G-specific adenine glycosylase